MKINIEDTSLPVYEALASKVRLQMMRRLNEKAMNIKELAEALDLSSAIMTMHVKKLEKAGLIRTEIVRVNGRSQKLCTLNVRKIEIDIPDPLIEPALYHETSVSVGHYTDFHVLPTCGLATPDKVIGHFDDPRYFLDEERVHAKVLWFAQGFIEYKIPNYLRRNEVPRQLDISMEISSEAPSFNENWPSDIHFRLNGQSLGIWTSPGDFGKQRGKLTPEWWSPDINQYGLLKWISINDKGTFMDGLKMSDTTLADLDIEQPLWTFRISVDDDAHNIGGVSLFGKGFGNYDQDLLFRLHYTRSNDRPQA